MFILICNVTYMKYYKGITKEDKPRNGGKFVDKKADCTEKTNFEPYLFDGSYKCLGYVEIGMNNKRMSIERLSNFPKALKNATQIEDVLVIFCAKSAVVGRTVVGWYKNATVFAYSQHLINPPQHWVCHYEGRPIYNPEQEDYRMIANSRDCVLLPEYERERNVKWHLPIDKNGMHKFRHHHVNLTSNERKILEQLASDIYGYQGENWV